MVESLMAVLQKESITMPNRHLLAALFLALFPLAGFAAPPKQPNILWLVSEDNNPLLGCYGDPNAKTPNLDKLASEGVQYNLAFANAPVCAPSRSTLITSVYASTTGTLNMRSRYPIPKEFGFYCTYLKQAGYYCMNPGKTDYNIQGNDKAPWDKGGAWSAAPAGKPWMLVINNATTHESCLHGSTVHPEFLKEPVELPAYHPDTPEIRSNWVEYYHKITKMDAEYGAIIDKLQKAGLADDTIVFYYSDHGGILTRSKRFVYDSGLRVPLIIRFGKNFQHLAPAAAGSKLDRLVSFVDFAPSLLSMVGGDIPAHMQGEPFLGPKAVAPREYTFGFRGRMDERYDLSYTVRDKQYRYIRNFMPHRIYGQHLAYLWQMPATVSWEKAYLDGKCNETQSLFWREKPSEELYDEAADHWEVKNLADSPDHRAALDRLRAALKNQMFKNRDAGLLPESEMVARAAGGPIFTMTHDASRYPFERIYEAADIATRRDPQSLPKLVNWMSDADPAVRYWAAVGCCVRGNSATPAASQLGRLLKDNTSCVRIAAAEALCRLGQPDEGLSALLAELDAPKADVLLTLNTLHALGAVAKPKADEIAAKLKLINARDGGRMNGDSGEKYTERAITDLLSALKAAK